MKGSCPWHLQGRERFVAYQVAIIIIIDIHIIIMHCSGDIKAFLDSSGHSPTIRTTTCELLTSSEKHARCNACSSYRKVLSAMLHRAESQQRDPDKCNPSSTTNYRYLNTPEKLERMKRLHADVKVSQQRARRLEKRYRYVPYRGFASWQNAQLLVIASPMN